MTSVFIRKIQYRNAPCFNIKSIRKAGVYTDDNSEKVILIMTGASTLTQFFTII